MVFHMRSAERFASKQTGEREVLDGRGYVDLRRQFKALREIVPLKCRMRDGI